MNNNKYLFLDDFREPIDCSYYMPAFTREDYKKEWEIVRSYDEFVNWIKENGIPALISFDHDLASEHYHDANTQVKSIDYNSYKEKTGYHCAKWLAEYCIENNIQIPNYYAHTMNEAGGKNIRSILESAYRMMKLSN